MSNTPARNDELETPERWQLANDGWATIRIVGQLSGSRRVVLYSEQQRPGEWDISIYVERWNGRRWVPEARTWIRGPGGYSSIYDRETVLEKVQQFIRTHGPHDVYSEIIADSQGDGHREGVPVA